MITYDSFGACTASEAEALATGLYEAETEEAHRKTEQTEDAVETEIGYHAAIATATTTETKGE